jgi:hypothetical protein
VTESREERFQIGGVPVCSRNERSVATAAAMDPELVEDGDLGAADRCPTFSRAQSAMTSPERQLDEPTPGETEPVAALQSGRVEAS